MFNRPFFTRFIFSQNRKKASGFATFAPLLKTSRQQTLPKLNNIGRRKPSIHKKYGI
jgi:hypothetical protein